MNRQLKKELNRFIWNLWNKQKKKEQTNEINEKS